MNEPPSPGGYSVTLPTFEGPLDLLLHLCQKHELDILDIPIGFVTEKYLEYLAVMQLINLDVASEYLVMAATLAHIKSKMLLPAPPPGQEDEVTGDEEDPREALIRRLLEYQKYKQAAADLSARGVAGQDVFLRGMTIENAIDTGLPPLAQVPLFSLVEAFQTVLSKSKVKLSHDIVHERVTLADRINELVDLLRVRRRLAFEELFEDMKTRFDLVITFLALLEMTRLRMTRLFQADFDSQIFIEFTAQVTADDDGEPGALADPPPGMENVEELRAAVASHEGMSLADGAEATLDTDPSEPRFETDRPNAEAALSPDIAFPADDAFTSPEEEAPGFDTMPPDREAPSSSSSAPPPQAEFDASTSRSHTIPSPPPQDADHPGTTEDLSQIGVEVTANEHEGVGPSKIEPMISAASDDPNAGAEANSSVDAAEEAPARPGDENT